MYENVTGDYLIAIQKSSRTFRAKVADSDGDDIECEVLSFKTYRASSDGTDLTAGCSYPQSVEIECYTEGLNIGDEITLHVGLVIYEGSSVYRTEYVQCGIFTITERTENDGAVSVKGYDVLYTRGSKIFIPPGPEDDRDLVSVATRVANQLGVGINADCITEHDYAGLDVYTFPETCTLAEAAGYVAGMIGGNAYIGRYGVLEMRPYGEGNAISAMDRARDVRLTTDRRNVTGIIVDTGEEELSYGHNGHVLRMYNPMADYSEALENISVNLYTVEYCGGTVLGLLGDPRVDPWDKIWINSKKSILCGSLTMEYDGGLTMDVESYATSSAETDIESKGPSESKLDQLEDDIRNSNSLFESIEELPDGSSVYYMHDNKDLNKSLQVWKFSGNGIELSTDGGESYPYGLTVDGDLIQRYIEAVTIKASQIVADMLTVGGDGISGIKLINEAGREAASINEYGAWFEEIDCQRIGNQSEDTRTSDACVEIDGMKSRALNMGMPSKQIITELQPTDNLNNYKTPGYYYCANSTDAGNITNCPVKYGFRMEVKLLGSTTRGMQIFYPHTTTPEYYMRKWSGNNWYAWHRFSGTAV